MKKIYTLSCVLLISFFITDIYAQNCSVTISGDSCTGTPLIAHVKKGALAKLTWYWDNVVIYEADTISSPASISVVAGNNGAGSAANQLAFPGGGIAVDKDKNVYVADEANNRVQKWAPGATSGVTVAGGNGQGNTANQLYSPQDVFVDDAGNIFVADAGNNRIQKWLPGASTGITVAGGNGAGTSAKQLNIPKAMYVDKQGNIYIADTYNSRIQKWKPGATKGVTVAGGNGSGGGANQFYYPVDVYLDAAKNIYVADAFADDNTYHRVQKWKQGDSTGVTVASNFNYLLAIYVDAAGNVYAADNNAIKKFHPGSQNGVIVAGGHSSGWDVLSYAKGVALDNNANIYAFDGIYNPRVQKYIPTNGITDTSFAPLQHGLYSVQAVLKKGCTTNSNNFIVRSTPETPNILATHPRGRGNLCSGGIDTFSVYAWDDITNYEWKIPAQCSLVANGNDSIIISVPAGFISGSLKVNGSNICGTSPLGIKHLLGKPVAPRYIKGPTHVFANQTNIIYSVSDLNSNHNWIVPADATIQSGQGTASISVNWGTTGGFVSVNSYNDCDESQRATTQVFLKNNFALSNSITAKNFNETRDAIIFPNPARNSVIIKFNSAKPVKNIIELRDITGKLLMQKDIISTQGLNSFTLNVSQYVAGVYLINIINAQAKTSLKFVKQ